MGQVKEGGLKVCLCGRGDASLECRTDREANKYNKMTQTVTRRCFWPAFYPGQMEVECDVRGEEDVLRRSGFDMRTKKSQREW